MLYSRLFVTTLFRRKTFADAPGEGNKDEGETG